jgi:hypothetical protein
VSLKFRPYGLASAVILEILTFGQIPTHSTTDTARVVKDVQNDIVCVKRRPTDASEMAKRWFKSQNSAVPPIKQPFALGAAASRFACPRKMGREKGEKIMSYLYVKWNSFGRGLLASSLAIKACCAFPWPLPERRPATP